MFNLNIQSIEFHGNYWLVNFNTPCGPYPATCKLVLNYVPKH